MPLQYQDDRSVEIRDAVRLGVCLRIHCFRGLESDSIPGHEQDLSRLGPGSGSHGDLWVKMFESGFHGKSPVAALDPRSEPVCMTRPVSDAASNSHPVAALIGRTNVPLASGEGSGGRDHSLLRLFKPSQISVRSSGSAGADQAPED